MILLKILIVSLVVSALPGCGFFAKKRPADPGNPLATANCPKELPPLTDDTFGGVNKKLVEVAGIYHECATAARGEKAK